MEVWNGGGVAVGYGINSATTVAPERHRTPAGVLAWPDPRLGGAWRERIGNGKRITKPENRPESSILS